MAADRGQLAERLVELDRAHAFDWDFDRDIPPIARASGLAWSPRAHADAKRRIRSYYSDDAGRLLREIYLGLARPEIFGLFADIMLDAEARFGAPRASNAPGPRRSKTASVSVKTAPAKDAGTPTWFWRAYRRAIRSRCIDDAVLSRSKSWTNAVTQAAIEVCSSLGEGVVVGTETSVVWATPVGLSRNGRLDVSAMRPGAPRLLVAFETELAPVGYLGRRHEKTWREEFEKLCGVPAELRVLSSYFMHGTGSTFDAFLQRELESMKANLDCAATGAWLFVFGSEDSTKDPDQPWLAFTLDENLVLEALPLGEPPLRPRRVARGLDPAKE